MDPNCSCYICDAYALKKRGILQLILCEERIMHVLEQNLQTKIKLELRIMSVKFALKFTNVDQ